MEKIEPETTVHPASKAYERPRLTDRRKKVLRFCRKYAECNGWAASIDEIAAECGAKHDSILRDLQALDKLDYIVFQGSRQIKVLMMP
jgi:SOS-response transcriptional repressor LexA